jgi:hypothetical protein
MKRLTDREIAQEFSLEWLKLSNKVLRAFPGSPRQRELQKRLEATPKYKTRKEP